MTKSNLQSAQSLATSQRVNVSGVSGKEARHRAADWTGSKMLINHVTNLKMNT